MNPFPNFLAALQQLCACLRMDGFSGDVEVTLAPVAFRELEQRLERREEPDEHATTSIVLHTPAGSVVVKPRELAS